MGCGLYQASCAKKKRTKAPEYCPKKNASDRSTIPFLAIVERGLIPKYGDTNTVNGVTITNNFANLGDGIRKLELLGKADVFPLDTISGTYSPSEVMETEVYGTQTNADFDQIKAKYDFKWKNHYTERNVEYVNDNRGNHNDKDIVMFTVNDTTKKGSLLIIQNRHFTIMSNGYKVEGDYNKKISGGFSIDTLLDGDPVPKKGYDITALYNELRLTFAAPVATGGVTASTNACIGDCLNYDVTSAGGTLKFAVVETTTCLCYDVFSNEDEPLETALSVLVTIDDTGLLTVGASIPAGTYTLNVVATNQQGHVASQCVKLTVS